MKNMFNSFTNAFRGICVVWKEERNFQIEILATIIILFTIFYFHFSFIEISVCIIAITLVLSAEIVNTVIEDVCNKIELNHDNDIRKIKDMSAGFVLVSVLFACVLGIAVFYHHFVPLFV